MHLLDGDVGYPVLEEWSQLRGMTMKAIEQLTGGKKPADGASALFAAVRALL